MQTRSVTGHGHDLFNSLFIRKIIFIYIHLQFCYTTYDFHFNASVIGQLHHSLQYDNTVHFSAKLILFQTKFYCGKLISNTFYSTSTNILIQTSECRANYYMANKSISCSWCYGFADKRKKKKIAFEVAVNL